MLNAGDLVSMGVLLPVSAAAGVVLGYVVYRAQINWYGDDKESARIKAIVLGLLTAIPNADPRNPLYSFRHTGAIPRLLAELAERLSHITAAGMLRAVINGPDG